MRTLYLECGMGAAGDMLMAALLELDADPAGFLRQMNSLGLPGVSVAAESCVKCGVSGTHMDIRIHGHEEENHPHDHHHHGQHLGDIAALIDGFPLSDQVKENAKAVYGIIAEAESAVHGVPVEHIHFHEVGTLDAVADVVGVCLLMERLQPEKIAASPVCVGSGTVRCAHGILPVPAPATARILMGVPVYAGTHEKEMCTPTGAALLKYFVEDFGPMPALCTKKIGYGMGTRDFPDAPNCVRAFLGTNGAEEERVLELICNLDDMTGEEIGFALERLLEAGALDAYTLPIGMKKSRPGVQLRCICRPADEKLCGDLIFRHTTTLGLRIAEYRRRTLPRESAAVETELGVIRVKRSVFEGRLREKPEYEDLAALARENDLSLAQVRALLHKKK